MAYYRGTLLIEENAAQKDINNLRSAAESLDLCIGYVMEIRAIGESFQGGFAASMEESCVGLEEIIKRLNEAVLTLSEAIEKTVEKYQRIDSELSNEIRNTFSTGEMKNE